MYDAQYVKNYIYIYYTPPDQTQTGDVKNTADLVTVAPVKGSEVLETGKMGKCRIDKGHIVMEQHP